MQIQTDQTSLHISSLNYLQIQSAENYVSNESVDTSEDNQEIMAMGDNTPNVACNAAEIVDESFRDGYTVNAELGDFLKRPVLIRTYSWIEGNLINQSFNPWVDYFNTPIITRKLQNYAFINCNLKVRILINASPFYYGYAIATYAPMVGGGVYDPGSIADTFTEPGAFMAISCRQRIDILPSKNQGGEMTLPFIWPSNWLRIGELVDFQAMGTMNIVSTDVLYNANGVIGSNVTIQVFAWAEDVMISAPTSELPLQSDEYKQTGKISSTATRIADAAGMAVGALPPLLKPYAMATEIGARGIASIASLFGYTNVPVVDDVSGFKNLPFHGLSSSEISTPQEKLTVDPKNELTIDNRLAGGKGDDELSIQYLCSKKNVFSLRNWASTDAPDSDIVVINVTPNLSLDNLGTYTLNSTQPCYHPPMTLVAKNFTYWRGTMVYRFKFICSQYHRGRIAVIWDPAHGTSADYTYTTNYSRIVDLAEESEIVIKVPFMQPTSYLFLGFNPTVSNIPSGVGAVTSFNDDRHNGRLVLRVLTNQTSPVSSADVLVYVETSMEDADFAGPRDPQTTYFGSYLQIQTEETNVIVKESNIAGIDLKPPKYLHSVYMGENISSMRQLMRRRSFYLSLRGTSGATTKSLHFTPIIPRKPIFVGFDPSNVNTVAITTIGTPTTFPYNFANELVCNMFAPCFAGERGSYNYDFNWSGPTAGGVDSISVSRSYSTYPAFNFDSVFSTTSTNNSTLASINQRALSYIGKNGSALTNQKTQAGLSIQAPYYSRYRFTNTNPYLRLTGNTFDDSDFDNLRITVSANDVANNGSTNLASGSLNIYCGIGTDYQLLCFVNVPSIWYYTTPPISNL